MLSISCPFILYHFQEVSKHHRGVCCPRKYLHCRHKEGNSSFVSGLGIVTSVWFLGCRGALNLVMLLCEMVRALPSSIAMWDCDQDLASGLVLKLIRFYLGFSFSFHLFSISLETRLCLDARGPQMSPIK